MKEFTQMTGTVIVILIFYFVVKRLLLGLAF